MREGLGRVVLSVVGLGWLGRKAMVLLREILSTARIQAASIVSLRGSAGLDRGGSKRCYHVYYSTPLRHRLQVESLSVAWNDQIHSEVYGITAKRIQGHRDERRKQSISQRRLIVKSSRKYMVLAHKRVSMVEIELVSSRSRRNDRTGLRRKQIVLPQRLCNVAEM